MGEGLQAGPQIVLCHLAGVGVGDAVADRGLPQLPGCEFVDCGAGVTITFRIRRYRPGGGDPSARGGPAGPGHDQFEQTAQPGRGVE